MESPNQSHIRRSLITLPLLVLERICDFLSCDPSRASLLSLALTSKLCAAAASRQRFASLTVTTTTREKLQSDVARWTKLLSDNAATRFVRHVTIIGYTPMYPDEAYQIYQDEDEDMPTTVRAISSKEDCQDYGGAWSCVNGPIFVPPTEPAPSARTYIMSHDSRWDRQDDIWRAFAQMLATFTGLRDFTFASGEQLPRCILAILHTLYPHPRLHMPLFDLRSLRCFRDDAPRDIDEHELNIATSPCLWSLASRHAPCVEDEFDFNEEAIADMIAFAAPNLRHVWLERSEFTDGWDIRRTLNTPRPTWRRLPVQQADGVGSLRTLILDGPQLAGDPRHRTWSLRTDFTYLTSLYLQSGAKAAEYQRLTEIASWGSFRNLQSLGLQSSSKSPYEEDDYIEVEDEAVGSFLSALPALSSLTLYGYIRQHLFYATLTRHGHSLLYLRLFLETRIRTRQLRSLVRHCTSLRELHLPVVRARGHRQEVEFYDYLANLPKLEKLTLFVYVTEPPYGRWTSARAGRLNVHHRFLRLRDVLINAAIDSNLACSIFRRVAQKQSKLRYLRLEPDGTGGLDDLGSEGDVTTSAVVDWLARSWVCERTQWQENRDEIISAKELAIWKRFRAKEDLEIIEERRALLTRLGDFYGLKGLIIGQTVGQVSHCQIATSLFFRLILSIHLSYEGVKLEPW
ncbi:hypothetical protein HIM_07526 [Hirsutella minnesotensis 3608]|uniref:Uncharacterized protein n=1 Tax=Hirsutella minnesotensis 3608 TaxID=1043627 RepID=A0A0F7ZYV7_9HYPO|nr:hypothetical protein HIM_07526 [Hirsutella minnesotensis 3608]